MYKNFTKLIFPIRLLTRLEVEPTLLFEGQELIMSDNDSWVLLEKREDGLVLIGKMVARGSC
jgi:hypothetical protein